MTSKDFEIGKRYAVFNISENMAMTHRRNILVDGYDDKGNIIYKDDMPRSRKRYLLKLKSQSYQNAPIKDFTGAVFEGWLQPITCDTDKQTGTLSESGLICQTMRGNACYNFIGTPEAIKSWIDTKQLNPLFDKSAVLAINGVNEVVVYPESNTGNHAVISRILTEAGK